LSFNLFEGKIIWSITSEVKSKHKV